MAKKIFFGFWLLLISVSLCLADSPSVPSPKGKPAIFRILDISERTYDGGPAVAVFLSESLDPKTRHDSHLSISDAKGLLKSAWVLSDDNRILYFPHAEPKTKYLVTVAASLQSAKGSLLRDSEPGGVSKSVVTREITPIISFASEGFLLPAKMSRGLPVVTVNVKNVEIEFFRLNKTGLLNLVDWQNTSGRKDYYMLNEAKQYGAELVFSGQFELDAPENRRTVCHVPVENIEALQNPGIYLAVMREPGEYGYDYQTTYFLITDIALHARVYQNESLIIASSLRTGEPLFDAHLIFYDNKGKIAGEGFTDTDGRYTYAGKLSGGIRMVKVMHGDYVGILPMNIPALDMSEFDLGDHAHKPREIYAYSPRDLYRPGEKFSVSVLLRNYDGKAVEPLPITAKLFRPDGREVRSFTLYSQDLGDKGFAYYQSDVKLAQNAPTGLWSLKFWDNPSDSPNTVFRFHVEEFLPERMKLELSSEQEFPGTGEDLKISISGEYLYGAPAAGNTVSAKVRVRAKREIHDTLRGFQFGDIRDENYQDYWELDEAALDEQGHFSQTVQNRWKDVKSPLSVKVYVDLYESGGRPVTRNIEKTIRPAETLVGIRPLFGEESADEGPVGFELVKVGPDGKPLPAPGLMAELTREDRDYYWEYSDSDGWQHKYTEKKYQYLTDTLKLDGKKPTPHTLHLQRGQYVLAIRDPETNLTTSLRFRVGYWWHGDDQGTAARPDKVLLKPDKPAYRPGDTVLLTVTPPHDGNAVILVEGEKPLWCRRVKVSAGGTQVRIPVSQRWDSHNLYISAVVFRPGDAKEKITPNRAVGLLHLPLDRSDRKLNIAIDAPEKVRSQGTMVVTIRNSKTSPAPPSKGDLQKSPPEKKADDRYQPDENPKPHTFVTIAAVDAGILSITDFKTPDPFAHFFERRRYDAEAYDIYGKVIESTDGRAAHLRYGGDADISGKLPDSEVKLVSLFQGPVGFDKNGEAVITFELPDFNGKLRLMAVAFSKDCFASAEKEVTVAAPTVTQLAMPRFLAPGDQTQFTLDVHNLSGMEQQLQILLDADPPLLFASLPEDDGKTLQLADGEKKTLRFPVKVKKDCGEGSSVVRLHLKGNEIMLERDWRLGIRPAYPAIARKVRKVLGKKDRTFTLAPELVRDMIPSTVQTDLKISPVIPLNIRDAMKGLIGYPYGCLEQTTSRAYPLLSATPDNIKRYDLPEISHEERINRLNKAVERLTAMQLPSGGFGLWSRSSPEMPWLTVYATEFLLRARDMGVEVSDEITDKALSRLDEYLQNRAPLRNYGSNREMEQLGFAVRSYAAYVLTKVGWAELGTLRTLYDNHQKQAGSGLPLAHLGVALGKMGDKRRSVEALVLAAQKRREKYGYWGDYGSIVRDLALSIALFLENKADELEGFDSLVLDMEDALRHRRWLSTQEKYAIFRAGISLEKQAGKEWGGRLTIAGKTSELRKKGSHLISPGVKDIIGGLSFVSETPGFLHTSAIVNGYTETPPPKDNSHISIERELYDTEGKFVRRDEFKVGELLVAHLLVRSKKRLPDALVVDLLPAGFELENQNLKHSVKLDDIQIQGSSLWRLRKQTNIVHEEYRDDRYVAVLELDKNQSAHLFYLVRAVSPGTFSFPPPFAESMYRPEIRGIGDTPPAVKILNKSK